MIFTRTKASNRELEEDIEINTIEELIDYVNKLDCEDIILWSRIGEKPIITEYDDYLE